MTWRDRPYAQEGDGGFGGAGLGLPRPTRVVTILLIVNFALFLLTALTRSAGSPLIQWGALVLPPAPPASRSGRCGAGSLTSTCMAASCTSSST